MALPRFFHESLPLDGSFALVPAEARHASNVLRLERGAQVVVFDGCGGEAQCTIADIDKRQATLQIEQRSDSDRELSRPLELWVALPKGDRQKTLIEGLVQLGVTRLIPLVCQRGVAQPNSGALERLRRGVLETSKQCGRNRLLEIGEPLSLSEAAVYPSHFDQLSLLAHPYGSSRSLGAFQGLGGQPPGALRVAVGPEGGFTDQEVSLLQDNKWESVSLGPRLLRIEMAALQIAAWWAALP